MVEETEWKTGGQEYKKPSKAFALPIQTVTLVPSTKNIKNPISPQEFNKRVDQTRKKLNQLFGGYSSWRVVGGFQLRGKLIKERVAFVTSYADPKKYNRRKSKWIEWVRVKKKVWGQKSMGIIIENDLYYI